MIKKFITLFKLGRKVSKSEIINIISKFQEPPLTVKILFKILSFSFSQRNQKDFNKSMEEHYSDSHFSAGHLSYLDNLYETFLDNPDVISKDWKDLFVSLSDADDFKEEDWPSFKISIKTFNKFLFKIS